MLPPVETKAKYVLHIHEFIKYYYHIIFPLQPLSFGIILVKMSRTLLHLQSKQKSLKSWELQILVNILMLVTGKKCLELSILKKNKPHLKSHFCQIYSYVVYRRQQTLV